MVLGIDSSTQSTKAVLVDASDGRIVESRTAAHPPGTEVDPRAWLAAFDEAAGPLLDRAQAIAVGGQQHGMVALDDDGEPVRDALLWHDTRSADAATDLIAEWGGPQACAEAVGSVLSNSFTATKLRWVRDHEPANAERIRTVMLPHDYVTWHLAGRREPVTDRGEASGTGYFSPRDSAYRSDLAESALGHAFAVPRIAAPNEVVGDHRGLAIAPGTGDNAAAALGLEQGPGDVVISIGTSGVACAVTDTPATDGTGLVAGFADATGRYLPLVATINAAKILQTTAALLGVDYDEFSALALSAPAGANGLVMLPYLDGERSPKVPTATGGLTGLTSRTTRADLARAAVEGLLCSLADARDFIVAATGAVPHRLLLIGGGAKNPAVRALAPAVLGAPVTVPADGEYVALGAARQAAWALSGADTPPHWEADEVRVVEADPTPAVREAYRELREATIGPLPL